MIKKEQVINIIDSVVQRSTISMEGGAPSIKIKESMVQRTEIKGEEERKRREEEGLREEREEQEKLRRQREEEERAQREDAERREKGRQKARQEEESPKRQREEQERKAIEKEELSAHKEPGGTSWKGLFAVALVLGALLLGYWALAPSATPSSEKTYTNSIGMVFVLIPTGEFDMGDSKNSDMFGPIHHVNIKKSFYMGKYEVTRKQWRDIMEKNSSHFEGDDLPVASISWDDIHEFITKLNMKEGTNKYRLPSEAEWEYSARAGTTTKFSFGDNESKLGEYGWYKENSGGTTHPVGQKNPNPWDLYDMHGNVLEWVEDAFHGDYNGAPTDGSKWDKKSSIYGNQHPVRGCYFGFDASICRSAYRSGAGEVNRGDMYGFRLVRDV